MIPDQRQDEMDAEDAKLCASINALGYSVKSVYDFINPSEPGFTREYSSAYPLLVQHLHIRHHPRIREGIIRALTVRDGGKSVWEPLLREFQGESDKILRWVLANALKTAMPYRQRAKHPEIAHAFSNYSAR